MIIAYFTVLFRTMNSTSKILVITNDLGITITVSLYHGTRCIRPQDYALISIWYGSLLCPLFVHNSKLGMKWLHYFNITLLKLRLVTQILNSSRFFLRMSLWLMNVPRNWTKYSILKLKKMNLDSNSRKTYSELIMVQFAFE